MRPRVHARRFKLPKTNPAGCRGSAWPSRTRIRLAVPDSSRGHHPAGCRGSAWPSRAGSAWPSRSRIRLGVPTRIQYPVPRHRAAEARRDAAAPVDRVLRRGGPGRRRDAAVPVQPVLRAARVLDGEGRPRDAAGPPRGREALRRLLGHEAEGLGPPHRRGDRGRALRGCPRGQQLHLRGGDADAAARGLRRLDDPGARVLQCGALDPRARSTAQRRLWTRPLRSGDQPDLRRDGGALRHGRDPRARR